MKQKIFFISILSWARLSVLNTNKFFIYKFNELFFKELYTEIVYAIFLLLVPIKTRVLQRRRGNRRAYSAVFLWSKQSSFPAARSDRTREPLSKFCVLSKELSLMKQFYHVGYMYVGHNEGSLYLFKVHNFKLLTNRKIKCSL